MDKIRKLTRKDFAGYVDIVANAYPGFKVETDKQKRDLVKRLIETERESSGINSFGYFRDGRLLGAIRLYDFEMTMFDGILDVGGGGLLAVGLPYKKERVAKELMVFFNRFFAERSFCMTTLHPFRPDFYRKMGYGYGTKNNRYQIRSTDIPAGNSKEHIRFLDKRNEKAMIDCYNRVAAKTHGMIKKCPFETRRFFGPGNRVIGYKEKRKILGYVIFKFRMLDGESFIGQDIEIIEMMYENPEVFRELMTFLRTQADQVRSIIFTTQEEYLHFLPTDPRDETRNMMVPILHQSNIQGVGIMYRIINVRRLFALLKGHNFGGRDCRLKLTITDSFIPANSGSYIIHFDQGTARLRQKAAFEVEVRIDISEFASLVMGVVDFRSLWKYGLADISDTGYIETVNGIFLCDTKPVCTTMF